MQPNHAKHTVLVPILNDDISANTYARASSLLLQRPDSQLILLHVAPADGGVATSPPTSATTAEPRWHRLARSVPTDRTFVDAVVGDPTTEILAEAERFHSDVIVY